MRPSPSFTLLAGALLCTSCAATYSGRGANLRNCAEQEATAEGRLSCFQRLGDEPGEATRCAEVRSSAQGEQVEPIGVDRQTALLKESQYLRHEAWDKLSSAPLSYDVDWGTALVGDESRNAMEWVRGALLGRDALITVGVSPLTRPLVGVAMDDRGTLKGDFRDGAPSASLKEALGRMTELQTQLSVLPEQLHSFFSGYYMALDKARATGACYRQGADAEVRMVQRLNGLLQALTASRGALQARHAVKEKEEQVEAQAEAAAWAALDTKTCQEAKTATACDPVEAYLGRFPGGAHAADAKAMLAAVEGTIRRLRDDAAWSAAVGPCTRPKASTDCDGVQKYGEDFPNGSHAAEAKDLLRLRRGTLAQLAAQEEAQRRAAAIRVQTACIQQCTVVLRECQKECSAGGPAAMPACQKACLASFHESCVATCRKK